MARKRVRLCQDSVSGCRSIAVACVLVFVMVCNSFATAAAQKKNNLQTDAAALERFRAAVDPTGGLLPWVSGTSPCTWSGVECYQDRVAILRLPGVMLQGPIPAGTVGELDELRVMSLHHNMFTGPFPAELTKCTILHALFLGFNSFSGPLPDFMGAWPRMTHFSVGFNNLSGPIPESLNAFTDLYLLDLQSNSFAGTFPDLVSPRNLTLFSVANNNLTGPVPKSLLGFPASAFVGNLKVCGPPTTNPCPPISLTPAPAPTTVVPPPLVSPVPASAIPAPNPIPLSVSPALAPSALATYPPSVFPVLVPPPASNLPSSIPVSVAPVLAPAPGATTSRSEKKLGKGKIVGIVIGVLALPFLIALCLRCCQSRRKQRIAEFTKAARQFNGENYHATRSVDHDFTTNVGGYSSDDQSDQRSTLLFIDNKRPGFEVGSLLHAPGVVLGKGSLGTAYKAVLEDGSAVTVKRLRDITTGRRQFETQMLAVGKMQHRNVVALRAFYFSSEEKLLVYDYMPLGSLSALLHDNRSAGSRRPLNWSSRVKIALGSARGLAYLHKEGGYKYAHGNIKSSNILLNMEFDPGVADFGLVQLLSKYSPAAVAASRIVGYRAPEVADTRKVTPKSDVYSFGVLLLELLTGKNPTPHASLPNDEGVDLPQWVQSVVREEWTTEVFDPELMRYQNIEEEMVQMLQVAMACIHDLPDRRPHMQQVVHLLQDIRPFSDSNNAPRNSKSVNVTYVVPHGLLI